MVKPESIDISAIMDPRRKEINGKLYHKIISSCFGAVLTSVTMTPFDVVKTRMQSGFMKSRQSTLAAMVSISKQEGIISLWRGLSPTLLLTIPQTAIYFVTYEKLKDGIVRELVSESYAPAISGIIARSFAVIITNPVELLRTRVQAGTDRLGSVYKEFRLTVKKEGIKSLGRGLGASLLRDAPFSAIYWSFIEFFKGRGRLMFPHRTYWQDLGISFVSGSASGIIAASLTHPFDVLKTLLQVSDSADIKRSAWRQVYKMQGLKGFWVGLIPRISKAAPACGIMISSYELGKRYLGEL